MPVEVAPAVLYVLAVLAFGSSLLNGAIGFGFGILSVNALAIAFGPKVGVVVLSLIGLPLSVVQVLHNRSFAPAATRLVPVAAAGMAGVVVGVPLLLVLPAPTLSIALGLFTAWYAIDGLRGERPPLPNATERTIAPLVGFSAGLTNGALGAAGPVLGTYLTAIGLRGREFAFGINLLFVAMGLVRGAILAVTNQYVPVAVESAALLLAPALLGQVVGFRVRGRVSAPSLRRGLLVILLVSAANLLASGAQGMLA